MKSVEYINNVRGTCSKAIESSTRINGFRGSVQSVKSPVAKSHSEVFKRGRLGFFKQKDTSSQKQFECSSTASFDRKHQHKIWLGEDIQRAVSFNELRGLFQI